MVNTNEEIFSNNPESVIKNLHDFQRKILELISKIKNFKSDVFTEIENKINAKAVLDSKREKDLELYETKIDTGLSNIQYIITEKELLDKLNNEYVILNNDVQNFEIRFKETKKKFKTDIKKIDKELEIFEEKSNDIQNTCDSYLYSITEKSLNPILDEIKISCLSEFSNELENKKIEELKLINEKLENIINNFHDQKLNLDGELKEKQNQIDSIMLIIKKMHLEKNDFILLNKNIEEVIGSTLDTKNQYEEFFRKIKIDLDLNKEKIVELNNECSHSIFEFKNETEHLKTICDKYIKEMTRQHFESSLSDLRSGQIQNFSDEILIITKNEIKKTNENATLKKQEIYDLLSTSNEKLNELKIICMSLEAVKNEFENTKKTIEFQICNASENISKFEKLNEEIKDEFLLSRSEFKKEHDSHVLFLQEFQNKIINIKEKLEVYVYGKIDNLIKSDIEQIKTTILNDFYRKIENISIEEFSKKRDAFAEKVNDISNQINVHEARILSLVENLKHIQLFEEKINTANKNFNQFSEDAVKANLLITEFKKLINQEKSNLEFIKSNLSSNTRSLINDAEKTINELLNSTIPQKINHFIYSYKTHIEDYCKNFVTNSSSSSKDKFIKEVNDYASKRLSESKKEFDQEKNKIKTSKIFLFISIFITITTISIFIYTFINYYSDYKQYQQVLKDLEKQKLEYTELKASVEKHKNNIENLYDITKHLRNDLNDTNKTVDKNFKELFYNKNINK